MSNITITKVTRGGMATETLPITHADASLFIHKFCKARLEKIQSAQNSSAHELQYWAHEALILLDRWSRNPELLVSEMQARPDWRNA